MQLLPVLCRMCTALTCLFKNISRSTYSMCSSYLFCQQNVQLLPDLSITHVASTCFVKYACKSYPFFEDCVQLLPDLSRMCVTLTCFVQNVSTSTRFMKNAHSSYLLCQEQTTIHCFVKNVCSSFQFHQKCMQLLTILSKIDTELS